MSTGHEADGAEQLERGDLGPQVLARQALRDHVDAGRVRQDVGAAGLE